MRSYSSRSGPMFAMIVLFAGVVALVPTALQAQTLPGLPRGLGEDPAILEAVVRTPELQVVRVGADGTIEVEPGREAAPLVVRSMPSRYAEGHYLLLTGGAAAAAGARELFHVEVTDVGERVRITLRVPPEVAAKVNAGMPAVLFRPVNATTARLRALPGRIPFSDASDNTNQAARLALYTRSVNNLKHIGLAMHNYHSMSGCFPPAVVFGPDGKPWHSWRVLILPYLEQLPLFNAYDFREPWDSPKNRALLDKIPDVYADPAAGAAKDSSTQFAALVGPTAIFRPEGTRLMPFDPKGPVGPELLRGMSLRDITDGSSNTWMISTVEPGRNIPWTKPEDIDAGPDFAGIGKPNGIATPFTFEGTRPGSAAPVLYADGGVRVIDATIKPEVMKILISCNGNEIFASNAVPTRPVAGTNSASGLKVLRIRGTGDQATASIE